MELNFLQEQKYSIQYNL